MSGKFIKKIKTDWQFPLLKYNVAIKYNEVERASGIAYILLELLQKGNVIGNKTFRDVLLEFGIPKDMHYLFSNVLEYLVDTDMVGYYIGRSYINEKNFPEISINNCYLTEKGNKIFKNRFIPTGNEKSKNGDVYYSPVTRRYYLECKRPNDDLNNSFLGEHILDSVMIDDASDMEDYLKSVKTNYGLKKDEIIVSVEENSVENKAVKSNDIEITISESGVDYKFKTNNENVFFEKYFSSNTVKDALEINEKYVFDEDVPEMSFEELKQADDVYTPVEMQKMMGGICDIYIYRNIKYERADNKILKIGNSADAEKLLNILDSKANFALINNSKCKYYMPIKSEIPCSKFNDTLSAQLLIEKSSTDSEYKSIMTEIFYEFSEKEFDENNAKIFLIAANACDKKESLKDYTLKQLEEISDADDKIKRFLEINEVFKSEKIWKDFFSDIGNDLFDASAKDVKIYYINYKNKSLSSLKKVLGLSDNNYISRFSANMKEKYDDDSIYMALEDAGFKTDDILSVVNVVRSYMRQVLDDKNIIDKNKLANIFEVIRINLWKLNNLLGVKSLSDYTLKDDYNVDEFYNAYSTLVNSYENIKKYKSYAVDEYKQLDSYLKIYNPIHESVSIDRESSSNPDKITREYIDKTIKRGRYKNAVSDLFVKLQYDANAICYTKNENVNILIDKLKNKGIIDENEKNKLHEFRQFRNNLQHPSEKGVSLNKEKINEWADIIFNLRGEKNESSSNNRL